MSEAARALSYPHIARDPSVAGGLPTIAGTRIAVHVLVRAHQLGMEFDEILTQYPSITPADLHAALLYYLDHQREMDSALVEAECW